MLSLLTSLVLTQGLHPPFSIPDGDFEMGGVLWQTPAGSTVSYEEHPDTSGAVGDNIAAHFPAHVPQSIWRTLAAGPGTSFETPSTADHLGTKLDFGLWFQLGEAGFAGGDALSLRIESGTHAIASRTIDPSTLPRGRWHYLAVEYDVDSGLDGCLRSGTRELTAIIEVDAGGEVWIDDLLGRPFDYLRFELADASFESSELHPAWKTTGEVGGGFAAYYGTRSLQLDGDAASLAQSIPCQGPGHGAQSGQVVEAGAWIWNEPGPFPDPSAEFRLQVHHVVGYRRVPTPNPATTRTLVAEVRGALSELTPGQWHYVETDPLLAVPLPHLTKAMRRPRLELRIDKLGSGSARLDYPQLGQQHSVDGNPKRFVYANYVARYRNPDFSPDPIVDAPTNELGKRWRNWYWGNPPACEPGSFVYEHDPRLLRGGNDPRDAGRRDLAISNWDEGPLPLLGAYDSRDPLIVDFHARLADACGLDALMFGWYGQKAVELDECAPRNQSVNGPALTELYAAIEAQGSDLKVATKMNLLRHASNPWANPPAGCVFTSEDTLELKREGIRNDLIWLVDTYFSHRATLKRENRMVIGVFDPERTFSVSDGPPTRLNEADWLWIKEGVEASTGKGILLVFDQAPPLTTPLPEAGLWFDGIATGSGLWRLAPCEVTQFLDFEAFQAGTPNMITLDEVRMHFRDQVLGRPYRWWRMDDAKRMGIAVVYPGYDDTGVSGWGNPNGMCTGGGTRCTRVVSARYLCGAAGERCYLELAFEEADRSGMNWVQIPTWNDWNEMTVLEPRYSARYVDAVLANVMHVPVDGDEDREWVLGRVLAAQAGIAAYRRGAADPREVEAVVRGFLLALGGTPYE